MAGAFTHMAIVAEAAKSFPPGKKFGDIIHANLNFLTLGTVSPDIPYLAYLKLTGFKWADVMHYFQTNGIVKNGMHSLAAAKNKDKNWECQLAWLIFKEIKNLEVSGAEYTDLLDACRSSQSYDQVAAFWDAHALVNCPFDMSFDAKGFVASYFKILDIADGGNALSKAFRHMEVISYIYQTYADITTNSSDLVKQFYSEISLPNGLTGSFCKDGFEYAVKNLVSVWSKIDRALFSNDNIIDIVPNWNLDTGVDQNTGIRTYWS